jgi:hypothetical protein
MTRNDSNPELPDDSGEITSTNAVTMWVKGEEDRSVHPPTPESLERRARWLEKLERARTMTEEFQRQLAQEAKANGPANPHASSSGD